MTLQQLSYFVTVAECGNITDAAEKLFISQPSLSAAIPQSRKRNGRNSFRPLQQRRAFDPRGARNCYPFRGCFWSKRKSCRSISA